MADELVSPLKEPLHVGSVSVPAVVLSPGKLPIQESLVHRRHFRGPVLPFLETRDAKKLIDAARVHGRHETSLVVEPPGIALRRDTVADEGEARGAKSDERIGVNRN